MQQVTKKIYINIEHSNSPLNIQQDKIEQNIFSSLSINKSQHFQHMTVEAPTFSF